MAINVVVGFKALRFVVAIDVVGLCWIHTVMVICICLYAQNEWIKGWLNFI